MQLCLDASHIGKETLQIHHAGRPPMIPVRRSSLCYALVALFFVVEAVLLWATVAVSVVLVS